MSVPGKHLPPPTGQGMMKALVTGSDGTLGRPLCAALSVEHTVVGTTIDDLDIVRRTDVRSRVLAEQPDVVIHLAAMTDVDACELRPDEALRVNATGTENVALACREAGCRLLYVSTGSVFDGRSDGPYTEEDTPNPVNAYGAGKYRGEESVRDIVDDYLIVRTCWLYGEGGGKFIPRFIERARREDSVPVVTDKVGSPTWSRDLASGIVRLIESPTSGTYHLANTGVASRFDMARLILNVTGIRCRLEPVDSSAFPLPAPRPALEALESRRLERSGIKPLRRWEEALTEYLATTE